MNWLFKGWWNGTKHSKLICDIIRSIRLLEKRRVKQHGMAWHKDSTGTGAGREAWMTVWMWGKHAHIGLSAGACLWWSLFTQLYWKLLFFDVGKNLNQIECTGIVHYVGKKIRSHRNKFRSFMLLPLWTLWQGLNL